MKNSYGDNKNKPTLQDSSNLYTYGVVLMLFISLLIGPILTNNKSLENSLFYIVLSFLGTPLALILAIGLLKVNSKKKIISLLKVERVKTSTFIAFLLLTFGLLFGLSEVNNIFATFLYSLGYKQEMAVLPEYSLANFIVVVIFVCLVPAFVEEMFFRGLITKGLKGYGKIPAVIISGFLFSIFHMNPLQTLYQCLAGCIFAFIVLYGGNYILTFIAHFLNNLLVVIFYYFVGNFQNAVLTVLGLVAIVIGIIILLYSSEEKGREKREKFNPTILVGVIICLLLWVLNLLTYMS